MDQLHHSSLLRYSISYFPTKVPRTSIVMRMYFEFEDLASIRKQLGSMSYAKGLIAAGLPIATVALTTTQSYSYKVFTGEHWRDLRDLCRSLFTLKSNSSCIVRSRNPFHVEY